MKFIYRDRGSTVVLISILSAAFGLAGIRAVVRDAHHIDNLDINEIPHLTVLIVLFSASIALMAIATRSLFCQLVLTDTEIRVRGVFRNHRAPRVSVRSAQAHRRLPSGLLVGASVEVRCDVEQGDFSFSLPGKYATLEGADQLARKITSWIEQWGIEEH